MRRSFIFFFCVINGFLFAQTEALSKILDEKIALELVEKKVMQSASIRSKNWSLDLKPNSEIVNKLVSEIPLKKISLKIENVYLYQKKNTNLNDIQKISQILRSLSKLEGIEYYSHTNKKIQILYEQSYVINDKTQKIRVNDPIIGSADGLRIFAYQKDSLFGGNVYEYSYKQTTKAVSFLNTNITPLSFSFLKLVNPNNLYIALVVEDVGDSLLLYLLTLADIFSVPGLDDKIVKAFSSRADAMYTWFIREYEQE